MTAAADDPALDMVGLLECVPREPVYITWPLVPLAPPSAPPPPAKKTAKVSEKDADGGGEGDADGGTSGSSGSLSSGSGTGLPPLLRALACLLRSLAVIEWLAGALTLLIRWAHSRSAQSAGGHQATARWGPVLVSGDGRKLMERLTKLHRYVLLEVRKRLVRWVMGCETILASEGRG